MSARAALAGLLERTGLAVVRALAELGYATVLLGESLKWTVAGPLRHQPVRIDMVFTQMMRTGVQAIPIVAVLAFVIGVMLAIQGIHTLRTFGAESQVVVGIALSVTREFAPLITGVLVAGRSGSALAAQIGTMQISQEVDALRVIGIHPVRYLVAPPLLAMLVMVPSLTALADFAGLLGGGVFSALQMDMSLAAYAQRCIEVLEAGDLLQGLFKSFAFAAIIALVGAINGFNVRGGAEGVGRAATRAVVMSITCIVVTDMIITYYLTL